MAKAILICGKICSGKTHYSETLKNSNTVFMSCDELMMKFFFPISDEVHDKYIDKAKEYLISKSIEIIKNGSNVVLDWGFWFKEDRRRYEKYFLDEGIDVEWHYVDVSDEVWYRNIDIRNKDYLDGKIETYFVDQALINKVNGLFEKPERSEIDVWVDNN